MSSYGSYKDLGVTLENNVAVVEIQRPPHNFFDFALIQSIASSFEDLGKDADCRAIVLCAQGKSFCAGADFSGNDDAEGVGRAGDLYREAVRLFRTPKPVVGAIQGAAIGGGLGLAVMPDFRVASPEARFAANFTRLGFHPGFGLTVTLPQLIGHSKAAMMFYTSRRIKGEEAYEMGLVDVLAPADQLREAAMSLAAEIAENSPLGVVETRATLRGDLAERVRKATDHELEIQERLKETEDFAEGVKATAERRVPNFKGR
ncbi:enoyl-CoA hydratase/isomerase family protein [Minwuia sp.]|uniref:enoyl-CoA hydratase/isomerase family protein n=1 Tax=Minwuia sp. TaxID=2493630 RepID=UPI003A94A5F4